MSRVELGGQFIQEELSSADSGVHAFGSYKIPNPTAVWI